MFYFIEYDPSRGERVSLQTFPDTEWKAAMDARLERELELHRQGVSGRELVVLQSDSLETLKVTHGRYFKSLDEIFRELLDAIAPRRQG